MKDLPSLLPEAGWRRYLPRFVLSWRRSRRQLIFMAGGIFVGAVAVAFAILADEAQAVFRAIVARAPWAPLVLTPGLFLGICYLTQRYIPQSAGSGIPQTIAARRMRHTRFGKDLISIRVAAGKVVLTFLGLMSGASIGREGPTVQIGAAIMSRIGTLTRIQRSGLILAGACAGIAAAFNTPLAGIVFGLEELSQASDRRPTGLTLATVVAAGLTALILVGNYNYFGTPPVRFSGLADWYIVPAVGMIGGFVGGLFSRVVIFFARGVPGWPGRLIARHPYIFAAVCGLGVAVCGLVTGGATFGTGYEEARGLLDQTVEVSAGFGIAKIVATLLSTLSGIPGGIFSPSLAVGAGLASNLSLVFPHADLGFLFLLGMTAYLTGVVQAPVTAVVIVMEMTAGHSMIIPLMATAIIAQTASRTICPKGIYHALAENVMRTAKLRTTSPSTGDAAAP